MPAAPSPTAAPALLQEVLREAATAGRPLVQALTEDARRELGTRAEKQRDAERRDELAEAASWLLRHQHALMEQWPEAWLKRCRDDLQASTERGGREAEFRFDELELMDEDQVQERVEVARALQIAVLASESALAELNGLISAVQGFSSVQPEANPLRPQLFVDTFLELARRTGVPSGVRNLWLSGAAESLGQRLKALYGDMIRMLRRAARAFGFHLANLLLLQGREVRLGDLQRLEVHQPLGHRDLRVGLTVGGLAVSRAEAKPEAGFFRGLCPGALQRQQTECGEGDPLGGVQSHVSPLGCVQGGARCRH